VFVGGRASRGEGGDALVRVATVRVQMHGRERFDQGSPVTVQVEPGLHVVREIPGLVERPRLKSRRKLALVNQPYPVSQPIRRAIEPLEGRSFG
jgi:hypothetical protein